jgi:hypothetical protein
MFPQSYSSLIPTPNNFKNSKSKKTSQTNQNIKRELFTLTQVKQKHHQSHNYSKVKNKSI